MKLLLDTHAFIWWDSDPERLSRRALALCQDSRNELRLSVASLWEIQIKMQLGKLKLAARLPDIVAAQQEANELMLVNIAANHVYALDDLPPHHKDPFDRMIIVQAKTEGLRLVSHDKVIREYPVDVEW